MLDRLSAMVYFARACVCAGGRAVVRCGGLSRGASLMRTNVSNKCSIFEKIANKFSIKKRPLFAFLLLRNFEPSSSFFWLSEMCSRTCLKCIVGLYSLIEISKDFSLLVSR